MQKEVNDQELTLKKRARRRLVGAIALVLLMIIVLPMILKDRSSKQAADEVTITLNNNQKPSIVPEASDFDSSVIPSDQTEPDSQPTDQKAASEAASADSVPSESASSDSISEPVDDPEAAAKPVETPKAYNKKSVPASKFYVQIGVFSDEANVKKLQAKLTDLGYKSQTEKIDTPKGKKIRLRTQLLGERNDAAIALQNIKDAGLTGMVVSQ